MIKLKNRNCVSSVRLSSWCGHMEPLPTGGCPPASIWRTSRGRLSPSWAHGDPAFGGPSLLWGHRDPAHRNLYLLWAYGAPALGSPSLLWAHRDLALGDHPSSLPWAHGDPAQGSHPRCGHTETWSTKDHLTCEHTGGHTPCEHTEPQSRKAIYIVCTWSLPHKRPACCMYTDMKFGVLTGSVMSSC